MLRYDCLDAQWVILNLVWNDLIQLDLINLASTDQIYDLLEAKRVILSNIRTDSNLTVGQLF